KETSASTPSTLQDADALARSFSLGMTIGCIRTTRRLQWARVSRREIALSNFLANAFDNVRRGALEAARVALPQRCELCASASAADLVCGECARALPAQRA